MVAEGVDVETAQTRAGHADPRVLPAIYAQATTEADRRAADLLDKRFLPPAQDGPAQDGPAAGVGMSVGCDQRSVD